jgi:hypothetical protein
MLNAHPTAKQQEIAQRCLKALNKGQLTYDFNCYIW